MLVGLFSGGIALRRLAFRNGVSVLFLMMLCLPSLLLAAPPGPTRRNPDQHLAYVIQLSPQAPLSIYNTYPQLSSTPLQTVAVGYAVGLPVLDNEDHVLFVPTIHGIGIFHIKADGLIGSSSVIKEPTPVSGFNIVPGSRLLFVRHFNGDVLTYRIFPDGSIHPTPFKVHFENANPISMVISGDGHFAYVLVETHSEPLGYSNELYQYKIGNNGQLIALSPSIVPNVSVLFPYTVAISPNSQYVYLFSQSSLFMFNVNKDGTSLCAYNR
jgi:hypothetical protein